MARSWLRRALLVTAASASALLLAACGGGSIESQFAPTRVVAFGDATADLGQTGTRYTINDGTVNIWTQQLAARYGLSLASAASGGTSYATAHARVLAKPDAAGNATTPTVKEQIDAFLGAGGRFNSGDLVVVSAGVADVVAESAQTLAGAQTGTQAVTDVVQAGTQLADQVRRLVNAGAEHVIVAGTYNLSKSPYATQTSQISVLDTLSGRFNEQLLVSIVDLGAKVLYVDAAFFYNLVVANPGSYETLTNVTTPVCTSVDAGAGIGTGAGQVSSGMCNNGTLLPGANPAQFLFADRVYFTPVGQRVFGDYAFDKVHSRW